MTRRGPLGGVVTAVIAVVLSVSGCAADQEALVDDPDLTKQAAIEESLTYLERTKAAMPEGMALSATSDAPDAISNEEPIAGSISCSGSDGTDDTDPHMAYLGYFVTGVPEGENTKYLMRIRRLWESWGWRPTEEPDGEWAAYESEAGYVLRVRHSGEDAPGTLSIEAQTPCIAGENFTGGEDVPMQIGDA